MSDYTEEMEYFSDGDRAYAVYVFRENALQLRTDALEAALDEIRLIALGEIEIMSDRQKHWNGKELYQIAKKAESALNGEVKE